MPVCLLLWKTPFFVCQFKQSKLKFCHLSKVECQYQHSLKCSCSPEGKLSRNLIQWIPYSAMKVLLVVEVATITANPEYVLCARIRIMCWKPETEFFTIYWLLSIRLQVGMDQQGKTVLTAAAQVLSEFACLYYCVPCGNTVLPRSPWIEPQANQHGYSMFQMILPSLWRPRWS